MVAVSRPRDFAYLPVSAPVTLSPPVPQPRQLQAGSPRHVRVLENDNLGTEIATITSCGGFALNSAELRAEGAWRPQRKDRGACGKMAHYVLEPGGVFPPHGGNSGVSALHFI